MANNLRIDSQTHGVYVDGTKISVRSMRIELLPDRVPVAEIELLPQEIDYEHLTQTELFLHPESIAECVRGVQFELQINQEFRDGFIASIKSALDDYSGEEDNEELARRILERVSGEC